MRHGMKTALECAAFRPGSPLSVVAPFWNETAQGPHVGGTERRAVHGDVVNVRVNESQSVSVTPDAEPDNGDRRLGLL